ncbi:alpha/beta hydrolase [Plantactinospora siamensis]|uniref:Alpha/beta hydrolase n=1 Tax=Plantactinospora siamensis TaxID=555372 RepID=A0ABV6NXX7_9ACTN
MTPIANVLWLHGGGWHSRSDEDGAALAAHGLRVVPGRYRLTGEASWPAQFHDARAAARAARAGAPHLPLLVAGDSAGGTLALHVGLRGVDEPGDVAGVLAFWPAVDPLAPDFLRLRRHNNPWTGLLGHEPAPDDPRTADATVTTHVGSGVPVLLAHGHADRSVPVSQSLDLAADLTAAGHPVHALVTHGGHALDLGRPDLHALVAAFLAAHLPARISQPA